MCHASPARSKFYPSQKSKQCCEMSVTIHTQQNYFTRKSASANWQYFFTQNHNCLSAEKLPRAAELPLGKCLVTRDQATRRVINNAVLMPFLRTRLLGSATSFFTLRTFLLFPTSDLLNIGRPPVQFPWVRLQKSGELIKGNYTLGWHACDTALGIKIRNSLSEEGLR